VLYSREKGRIQLIAMNANHATVLSCPTAPSYYTHVALSFPLTFIFVAEGKANFRLLCLHPPLLSPPISLQPPILTAPTLPSASPLILSPSLSQLFPPLHSFLPPSYLILLHKMTSANLYTGHISSAATAELNCRIKWIVNINIVKNFFLQGFR
jgi:hypothetical protein